MLNPIKSPTFPHGFCPREAGLPARHLQLRLRLGYSIYLAAKLGRESMDGLLENPTIHFSYFWWLGVLMTTTPFGGRGWWYKSKLVLILVFLGFILEHLGKQKECHWFQVIWDELDRAYQSWHWLAIPTSLVKHIYIHTYIHMYATNKTYIHIYMYIYIYIYVYMY